MEKDYEYRVLVWEFYQYQLRRKYKHTPAGFQSEEEEKISRNRWKENVKKFRQGGIICSFYQTEAQPFAGRKQELSVMERKIKRETGMAVLYGIGGIGKTALAKEYIRLHREEYAGILYLTFGSSIKNIICNDVMLDISNLKYHPEKYRTLSAYFDVKMGALREILKRGSYLMVMDDCNIDQDGHLERVLALPCHKIITTRVNPESWGYEGIEVNSFRRKEEWNEFFELYKGKRLSEEEKKKLWDCVEKTQGHPLSVKLQMYNEKEITGAGIGKDILQRFGLRKREQELLMYLSIMPSDGIFFSLFQQIARLEGGELDRLEKILLIQTGKKNESEEQYVSMHPLIAEAVRAEYPITTINGRKLLKGMEAYLNGDNPCKKDMWECAYGENRKLEPYIFSMIEAFPEPEPWMSAAFDRLATFLWIQGYFKQAEQYELKIYDAVKKYYGEIHQLTGQMAMRVAAVYYNRMDLENADKWYLQGLTVLKTCKPLNQEYHIALIQSFSKAARLYWDKKEYRQAICYIDEAIGYYLDIEKKMEERGSLPERRYKLEYPYSILLKAKILFAMQRYEEAEELYYRAAEVFMEVSGDEFRFNEFQELYIKILIQKGDYKKAEHYALENMNRELCYRGEEYRDTLKSMEQTADIWMKSGREAEAITLYRRIMRCLRKEYPYQESWIKKISLKMNC